LKNSDSINGAAIQRGLEHGSRKIAIVGAVTRQTTNENTGGWKRQRDFVNCGNSGSVIVICSNDLYVVSKSKTPSIITPYYVTILILSGIMKNFTGRKGDLVKENPMLLIFLRNVLKRWDHFGETGKSSVQLQQ
jgi:hypothetical protein